ncbi:hypothetical protein L2737_17075 [Shewanella electrodiphila]|uniref:Uncharacterized protein n=1 Tax=Shewanella electrodiphila TaxID=934143 RepID=A0ABT0KTA3_9GAMM|nr:hypothetical protein [Shewanella electrodiphila]MCL1047014.1 hypothetical protein [Shewanella electrodiphila]
MDNFVSYENAPFDVLEEGVHDLSLPEFRRLFVYNPLREKQFLGLVEAMKNLRDAGCSTIYIDGSYVTQKAHPGDFDACVDYSGVDLQVLDPVFRNFDNQRQAQKDKYEGEFFPHLGKADSVGTLFLDFFQNEKHSGKRKGIVKLDLNSMELRALGEEK